jgi:hypothetical protein
MINRNIFFIFVKALNKNYMFKVCLSIFIKIQTKLKFYFITFK